MSQNMKALAASPAARAHDNSRDSAVGDSAALAHDSITATAQESIHSSAAHAWLTHFSVGSRFRVGLWFNIPAKWARGRLTSAQLLNRVRQNMREHIRAGYEPQHTDACRVLQALADDPQGALDYAHSVIQYQQLPVEEQARVRAARGEAYKRTAMAAKPPSSQQLALLRRLGHSGPMPQNCLEAHDLIDAMKHRGGTR